MIHLGVPHSTNLQNRSKKNRQMFIPHREQNIFLACDASQAEAWIVATLSNDKVLFQKLLAGEDIHKYTASLMLGKPIQDVIKSERDKYGKRPRHACNYCMGPMAAAELFEVSMSEAKELIERFHLVTPLLRGVYYKHINRLIFQKRKLTSPHGFTRQFTDRLTGNNPKIYRDAAAHIPQHTVGVLINWALGDFYHSYIKHEPEIDIAAQVHDEIICETPPQRAVEVATRLTPFMRRPLTVSALDTGELHQFSIPCDFSIGLNLGPQSETNPSGMRDWIPADRGALDELCAEVL